MRQPDPTPGTGMGQMSLDAPLEQKEQKRGMDILIITLL